MKLKDLIPEQRVKITDLDLSKHSKHNRLYVPTEKDETQGIVNNKYGVEDLNQWINTMTKKYGVKDVIVKNGEVFVDNQKFKNVKQKYIDRKAGTLDKWGTTE
jgi:hypothetical protein